MLLEDLPEAGVVQVLIILQEDERQVELGEGEFEFLKVESCERRLRKWTSGSPTWIFRDGNVRFLSS